MAKRCRYNNIQYFSLILILDAFRFTSIATPNPPFQVLLTIASETREKDGETLSSQLIVSHSRKNNCRCLHS